MATPPPFAGARLQQPTQFVQWRSSFLSAAAERRLADYYTIENYKDPDATNAIGLARLHLFQTAADNSFPDVPTDYNSKKYDAEKVKRDRLVNNHIKEAILAEVSMMHTRATDQARQFLLSAIAPSMHGIFSSSMTPFEMWRYLEKASTRGIAEVYRMYSRVTDVHYNHDSVNTFLADFDAAVDPFVTSILPPKPCVDAGDPVAIDQYIEETTTRLKMVLLAKAAAPQIVGGLESFNPKRWDLLEFKLFVWAHLNQLRLQEASPVQRPTEIQAPQREQGPLTTSAEQLSRLAPPELSVSKRTRSQGPAIETGTLPERAKPNTKSTPTAKSAPVNTTNPPAPVAKSAKPVIVIEPAPETQPAPQVETTKAVESAPKPAPVLREQAPVTAPSPKPKAKSTKVINAASVDITADKAKAKSPKKAPTPPPVATVSKPKSTASTPPPSSSTENNPPNRTPLEATPAKTIVNKVKKPPQKPVKAAKPIVIKTEPIQTPEKPKAQPTQSVTKATTTPQPPRNKVSPASKTTAAADTSNKRKLDGAQQPKRPPPALRSAQEPRKASPKSAGGRTKQTTRTPKSKPALSVSIKTEPNVS